MAQRHTQTSCWGKGQSVRMGPAMGSLWKSLIGAASASWTLKYRTVFRLLRDRNRDCDTCRMFAEHYSPRVHQAWTDGRLLVGAHARRAGTRWRRIRRINCYWLLLFYLSEEAVKFDSIQIFHSGGRWYWSLIYLLRWLGYYSPNGQITFIQHTERD